MSTKSQAPIRSAENLAERLRRLDTSAPFPMRLTSRAALAGFTKGAVYYHFKAPLNPLHATGNST